MAAAACASAPRPGSLAASSSMALQPAYLHRAPNTAIGRRRWRQRCRQYCSNGSTLAVPKSSQQLQPAHTTALVSKEHLPQPRVSSSWGSSGASSDFSELKHAPRLLGCQAKINDKRHITREDKKAKVDEAERRSEESRDIGKADDSADDNMFASEDSDSMAVEDSEDEVSEGEEEFSESPEDSAATSIMVKDSTHTFNRSQALAAPAVSMGQLHGDSLRPLELTVQAMSGTNIGVLWCSPSDTVYEVKQQLSRLTGEGSMRQHLVYGGIVLQDSERLGDGRRWERGIEDPQHSGCKKLTVNCVCVGPSTLASFLDEEAKDGRKGEPLHAVLADVADSVMRHEHTTSMRYLPSATDVTKAVAPPLRAKLITWMIEAFDVLDFSPDLLYGTVMTLDRYCASLPGAIENSTLGTALLAAIGTEMKLSSQDMFPQGHWQRLLHHLCQGRFALSQILHMEHQVLCRLQFVVSVPTTLTFFTSLSLRIQSVAPAEQAKAWIDLGSMLLSLTLLDAELHYRRPHAVLAAGVLSAALGVFEAPATRRADLLEDLAAYLPDARREDLVLSCEEEVLAFWAECSAGRGKWFEFFGLFERISSARTLSPLKRLRQLGELSFDRAVPHCPK